MLTHILTLPYTLFYKPLLIFGFKRGCVVHPCCVVYINHQCYISLPMFYWWLLLLLFFSLFLFSFCQGIIIILLIWCSKDYVGCVTIIVLFVKYYSSYWCYYYYYCIVITITVCWKFAIFWHPFDFRCNIA